MQKKLQSSKHTVILNARRIEIMIQKVIVTTTNMMLGEFFKKSNSHNSQRHHHVWTLHLDIQLQRTFSVSMRGGRHQNPQKTGAQVKKCLRSHGGGQSWDANL